MVAVSWTVKVARLDDDAAKGEHVGSMQRSTTDAQYCRERDCGLGVGMLRIDAKVVLFREVPAVERHVCVFCRWWGC